MAMLDYGAGTVFENEATGKAAVACQEQDAAGKEVRECDYGVAWSRLANNMKVAPDSMCNVKYMDWTDGTVHNGGEAGSQTLIFVLPKAKTFAVVLTSTSGNNEEAADMLMNDLLSATNNGTSDVCKYPESTNDNDGYAEYDDDDGTSGARLSTCTAYIFVHVAVSVSLSTAAVAVFLL